MTSAGYDLDYRLTSLAVNNGATPVSSLAYAYSDGMNLTGISDSVTPANSNTLWYTPANRLQNANGPWGNTTNYYDLVGNRTYNINTVGAVTTERVQSYGTTANRLTGITENTAAFRSYTYDNAGNTLTETRPGETFAYTYNKRNRLASVTRNAVAYASYGYNALEQLTSRNTSAVGAPAGTVHYIYDNDNHLIAEANASTGAITRDYIWLASNDNDPIDLPLAIAETTTLTMVHADHLGRPTRMTDATKATVWQAIWKPWGEIHQLSGTLTQNLRYPGQYFQIETGLHYNHHRHYDPITGRYTQPDPLRFVDGPSVYAYAGNSPYMNVDREGLDWSTSAEMSFSWLFGTGSNHRTFGPGSSPVDEMKSAPGVNTARAIHKTKGVCTCQSTTNVGAGFGLAGAWDAGLNPTRQYLGSYRVNVYPIAGCKIRIVISNNSSFKSFAYGIGPDWERGNFNLPFANKQISTPMGNMRQTIWWDE